MAAGQFEDGDSLEVPIKEYENKPNEVDAHEMPIELEGVLDNSSWTNFASQINARLAVEFKEIGDVAAKYKPFKCIGVLLLCGGLGAFLLLALSAATGWLDTDTNITNAVDSIGFLCIFVLCSCGYVQGHINSAAEEIKAESVRHFDAICERFNMHNSIVRMQVNSDHGMRFVEIEVVAGMLPGSMPHAQQQMYVQMQQQIQFAGIQPQGFQQPGSPQQLGFPGMPLMPGANPLLGSGTGAVEMTDLGMSGSGGGGHQSGY